MNSYRECLLDALIIETQHKQEFEKMQERNELTWLKKQRDFISSAFETLGYPRIADMVLDENRLLTLRGYVILLESFASNRISSSSNKTPEQDSIEAQDAAWVLNAMYIKGLLKGDLK